MTFSISKNSPVGIILFQVPHVCCIDRQIVRAIGRCARKNMVIGCLICTLHLERPFGQMKALEANQIHHDFKSSNNIMLEQLS